MSDVPKTIWLQRPNRDSMSEWCNEVTWCEDKQNDDDTCYIKAGVATAELANEIESLRQRVNEVATDWQVVSAKLIAVEKERDEYACMSFASSLIDCK